MWFAFYTGIIDWTKVQRIEARMDGRVGVHGELTKPVDLIIRGSGCFKVTRSFLDEAKLTAYVTNACNKEAEYWELHANSISPDGTIISSWYTNGNGGFSVGDTREFTRDLEQDARTAKVIVWAQEGFH